MDEHEELNSSLGLFAKTSVFIFVGTIFSKVFTYIYRIIIARHFGPEVYGLLILTITISALSASLFSFGLIEGLLRFVALYRGKNEMNKIKYIFRTSMKFLLFSSIFAGTALFFLSGYLSIQIFDNPNLEIFLKTFSFIIPFVIFGNAFMQVIKAYEKIKWHSFILLIFESFIKVLSIALLIFIGFKTKAILFSYFLGIFMTFSLSYYVCKYKIKGLFEKYSLRKDEKRRSLRNLFNYSIPLLISGIIFSLFYGVDSFLIGYFKGAVEVGIYNAAVPIAILIAIVPGLFLPLFFPLITKEYSKRNFKLIKNLSHQIAKWIFVVAFPLFVLIMMFSEVFLNILFGADYLGATTALRFLLFSSFFGTMTVLSSQLILISGRSKLILFDMIVAVILNIILNFILIPLPKIFFLENSLGINGAAMATMTSLIFLNLLYLFQASKYASINPIRKQFVMLALLSAPSIIFILYIKSITQISFSLFVSLSLFFLLSYLLFLLLFKGLDKNDLKILKSFKNKFYS